MPGYRFTIHDGGTSQEYLGSVALADDAEAHVFGRKVIRDLIASDAARYAGWTMDIIEGERAVDSIPFGAVWIPQQER